MNCDLLNRFVVIGGPYFKPGPNLQSQLQEQVGNHKYINYVYEIRAWRKGPLIL